MSSKSKRKSGGNDGDRRGRLWDAPIIQTLIRVIVTIITVAIEHRIEDGR